MNPVRHLVIKSTYNSSVFIGIFVVAIAISIGAMSQSPPQVFDDAYAGPLTWEVVMSPTESWETDGAGIHMPWIIYEGSVYKMWYRVAQPTSDGSAGGKIAYATSEDGINWQGKQLLLESGYEYGPLRSLRRPVVITSGSEYWLYNTQYYTSPGWSLYVTRRTCTDGVSWSAYQSVLDPSGNESWEYDSQNVRAIFEQPGGGYRMFYSVRFSTTASPDMFWATAVSTDGITWTDRSQLLGADNQPLFCTPNHWYYTFDLTPEGVYRCLYSDGSGALQIAVSVDGIHWNKGVSGYLGADHLAQVLSSPPSGAYGGCLVRLPDNTEYLYFWSSTGTYRICRALLSSSVEAWNEY